MAAIESTPVCGVAIRNEADAPREAPLRLMEIAVGSTPQEQSGNGTPSNAALSAGFQPLPDRWRAIAARGTNT